MSGVGASKAAVRGVVPVVPTKGTRTHAASSSVERPTGSTGVAGIVGVHHVGMICKDLEKSVVFYRDVLGLPTKMDRPDDKLPFRGAWFWIGTESIHLMEVPNPDPTDLSLRPEHGGRDRHFCMGKRGSSCRWCRRAVLTRFLSLSPALTLSWRTFRCGRCGRSRGRFARERGAVHKEQVGKSGDFLQRPGREHARVPRGERDGALEGVLVTTHMEHFGSLSCAVVLLLVLIARFVAVLNMRCDWQVVPHRPLTQELAVNM